MHGLRTKLTAEEQELGWAIRHNQDLAWAEIPPDTIGVFQQCAEDPETGDWLHWLHGDPMEVTGLGLALIGDVLKGLKGGAVSVMPPLDEGIALPSDSNATVRQKMEFRARLKELGLDLPSWMFRGMYTSDIQALIHYVREAKRRSEES